MQNEIQIQILREIDFCIQNKFRILSVNQVCFLKKKTEDKNGCKDTFQRIKPKLGTRSDEVMSVLNASSLHFFNFIL
jgi:hypothetical protein